MCSLPLSNDVRFLNRDEPNPDAGIFQIDDNTALVQSVDFFTPVVDDPYLFGQIAAANALSDIYAVGGQPLTVMNLVCFPCGKLPVEVLKDILLGGQSKVEESGAVMVGGHSIDDPEPKYGLSVTGVVNPGTRVSAAGARPGDCLVLTKPLGTGIITTSLKGEVITIGEADDAVKGMVTLNRAASEVMLKNGVSACTDITGFGLLGHAAEMAGASSVGLRFFTGKLPAYKGALELADQGFIPAGTYRNWEYFRRLVRSGKNGGSDNVPGFELLADPQTSGGLLISIASGKADRFMEALQQEGVPVYLVGEVYDPPPGTAPIEVCF